MENNDKTIKVRDEQGNTWLVAPSALQSVADITDMGDLPPLTIPKPSSRRNLRDYIMPAIIFASVFLVGLLILNLPAITKAVTYSTTHSEEKDNQALTEQYRALYGYNTQPELGFNSLMDSSTETGTYAQINQTSQEELTLSVPKLNLTAPVISVPSGTDTDIFAALKNGVVIFPGSSLPGQNGQTVIIGHSSSLPPWTKYSAIFANLNEMVSDDLIHLTLNGQEYIYRVSAVRRGSVDEILSSGMTGDLILSTCWPVGSDTNRVAVSAIRIK